jgi:uncharacterized protein YdbL (DUF1318 family)
MKQLKLRNIFALFTLLLSLVAAPAWALTKDDAKAQGLMGEQSNGYLGIVTTKPTQDLKALVAQINNKRRAAYAKGATKAGVERSVFELRMGQRLQERSPAGHYIQLQNGKWKKK